MLDENDQSRTRLVLGLVVLTGGAVWLQSMLILNWDVSFFLYCAQRLLEGGSYTGSFFETNPPLILFLYVPPVLLSEATEIPLLVTTRFYIFAILALSVGSVYVLLQRVFSGLMVEIGTLLVAALFLFVPREGFGQREHLAIMLVMPYALTLTVRSLQSHVHTVAAIATGLAAGVGFSLKPYFFVPFLLVEAVYVWQRRSLKAILRPESASVVLVAITYGAVIWIWFTDYLTVIVPLVNRYYYPGMHRPFGTLFGNVCTLYCVMAWVLWGALTGEERSRYSVLIAGMTGFYGAFLLGRMGWYYHGMPALCLALFVSASILWDLRRRWRRSHLALAIGLLVFYVGSLVYGTTHFNFRVRRSADPLIEFIRKNIRNESGYFLSTSGFDFLVVPYVQMRIVSRFPSLWMLPGILRRQSAGRTDAQATADERYIVDTIVADLEYRRPRWIILDARDENKQLISGRFDYVGYFSRYENFRRAWMAYGYVGQTRNYEYFRLKQPSPSDGRPSKW